MEDIQPQRCIRARTTADTCQARAENRDVMTFLAPASSNIKMERRRITTGLSREALRELRLSELQSFMEDIQLV